jgi:DNA-binding winged helix-turn-helix (wHTH) protein
VIFTFDGFELDSEALQLRRGGRPIRADALVLRLLGVLLRHAGELVTKETLFEEVWGREVAENVLTVSMVRLRRTLGHKRGEREFVLNVYGRGYRFVRAVTRQAKSSCVGKSAVDPQHAGPPFVGRERVLALLRPALHDSVAGHGRAFVLIGEAGIGKTRLAEALEHEALDTGLRGAWGYCRESDSPPLGPWTQLVREMVAGRSLEALRQHLGGAARDLTRILPELSEGLGAEVPAPARPGSAVETSAKHATFDAVLRTLELCARDVPRLLVLEDLHWSDAASLELLSYAVDAIAHTRILLLATMRDAEGRRAQRASEHLAYVLGHRNCERVVLERLHERDVANYVAALFDDPEGALGRAVFDKSAGNAFFMAELSRQLRDAAQPGPEALAVPGAALDLVRQRMLKLDHAALGVLSCAAVIGRHFELGLLQAVCGRPFKDLMASLDEAIASGVLVAAPESVTEFGFSHELQRAALYEGLDAPERRRWHLRVADVLEQRKAAAEAVSAAELAYHAYAALPESDPRKVVTFCRQAAAAATAAFAPEEATRYTRHALEALELVVDPSPRLRLGLLFNMALYARNSSPEFVKRIREVVQVAREQNAGPILASAAMALSPLAGFKPMAETHEALAHALRVLPEQDTGMRAASLAMLARAAPNCFDAEQSRALSDQGLALANLCGESAPRSLSTALRAKLYLEGGPAHGQDSHQVLERLERLAQSKQQELPVLSLTIDMHRAIACSQAGEPASAASALERCEQRARLLHHEELIWHSERAQRLLRINAGEFAHPWEDLEVLHQRAELKSMFGTELFCAFDRSVVLGEFAPIAIDAQGLRAALAYDASEPPSVWSLKLRALAAAGLHDEARSALHAVKVERLASLPCDRDHLGTLGQLTRAALLLSELEYAAELYRLLAPYPDHFALHVSFLCDGSVAQLLGMLARALGRTADARHQLEAALVHNERVGLAPRAAETRLELARCLLDGDGRADRERARVLATEAKTRAEALGRRPLAAAATQLLQ